MCVCECKIYHSIQNIKSATPIKKNLSEKNVYKGNNKKRKNGNMEWKSSYSLVHITIQHSTVTIKDQQW